MILNLILSCAVVAGVAILWRNFRYDRDITLNYYLDRLPYLMRKPITCGVCFTYWVGGAYTLVADPLMSWLPPLRFSLGAAEPFVAFFFSWMIVGTGAAGVVYLLDTFFEISHYYQHRAHGGRDAHD